MTDTKSPEPDLSQWADLLWFMNRDLVRLDSPVAHTRLAGIQELMIQHRHDAFGRFKELLQDDAPVIWGGGTLISEIRMFALAGLQRLKYAARSRLELAPVAVMRPWRVTDVRAKFEQVFTNLSESQRQATLQRVNEVMEQRVQPFAEQADDVRAYCVLQTLGLVTYQWQRPDPQTTLTPLQEEMCAEQVATPRPPPCLRVALRDSPDKILGWIYRNPANRIWPRDFSDQPAGDEAGEALSRIMTLGTKGIPHVRHDASGRPVRSADRTFVIDGDLDPDTGDVIECLRSIAALLNEYATELYLPAEHGR